MILNWDPSIALTDAPLAKKACTIVLGILGISNSPCLSFTLVCLRRRQEPSFFRRLTCHVTLGFIGKVKKILEAVCHNCGKLLDDEVSS